MSERFNLRDMITSLRQLNCRSASGTLLKAFLCRSLFEFLIVLVLLARVGSAVD